MKHLKLNEPITFGRSGSIRDYATQGWDLLEDNPTHTWTQEVEASLRFRIQPISTTTKITISGVPFSPAENPIEHQIWLHLNGFYCGFFVARENFEKSFLISNSFWESKENTLTITCPNAKSPRDLGLSQDSRNLGVALGRLTLNTLSI